MADWLESGADLVRLNRRLNMFGAAISQISTRSNEPVKELTGLRDKFNETRALPFTIAFADVFGSILGRFLDAVPLPEHQVSRSLAIVDKDDEVTEVLLSTA